MLPRDMLARCVRNFPQKKHLIKEWVLANAQLLPWKIEDTR